METRDTAVHEHLDAESLDPAVPDDSVQRSETSLIPEELNAKIFAAIGNTGSEINKLRTYAKAKLAKQQRQRREAVGRTIGHGHRAGYWGVASLVHRRPDDLDNH